MAAPSGDRIVTEPVGSQQLVGGQAHPDRPTPTGNVN
jgi:hypothetical protein